MHLDPEQRASLDTLIKDHGYQDYQWIDPRKIIVAQWVRMKCLFGCGAYGRCAACPPNTPSIEACERFFSEYAEAVVIHFPKQVAKPEDRHVWSRKVNADLLKLERDVFLAGFEKAFLLFMDSCGFCKECSGVRATCIEPRMARPTPEGMGVDVYGTVRQFGFPINVRTDYDQEMDRYAFLMVR